MIQTVRGIVLSYTDVGEYDRFLTVLSFELGKISVYGNGVRKLKNPNFVSAQKFTYSEFTLRESGGKYYIKETEIKNSFYGIRSSIDGIALAEYIAEVAADISLEGERNTEILRLTLNSLYLISEGKKPKSMIKAVFELRAASEIGFKPGLVACNGCGKHNLNTYYFDAEGGYFNCEECFKRESAGFETELARQNELEGIYAGTRLIMILSPDVYVAMRYIIYSKQERIFSFELKDGALNDLCSVCEKYFLCHMEKNYKTLEFYKQMTSI